MIDDGSTRDEFAPEEPMSGDEMSEMPDVQHDPTLRDVVAALGALPAVSEADVQRIVARAAADAAVMGRRGTHRWAAASRPARATREASPGASRPRRPEWFTSIPMAAAAALVLAAGIGGFVLRDLTTGGDAVTSTSRPEVASLPEDRSAAPVVPVAADASAEAPIATQFVLDAPGAAKVALVGAFNGWNAGETPLVHDPATGLWSVSVPLAPGRHVYAFMVDDSVLTLDPRAPSARDEELGTTASVILVGTP